MVRMDRPRVLPPMATRAAKTATRGSARAPVPSNSAHEVA